MYRPRPFVVDDIRRLHATIVAHPFATIVWATEGAVKFAYAPVVLDANSGAIGGVRFHLARANPVASVEGSSIYLTFRGPDSYVSPDWYRSRTLVPTWNYVAVEANGIARRLDDDALKVLLVDLSAQEESKLRPKGPWTIDKVPAERLSTLLNAIVGFSVALDAVEGKFKLSQDKSPEDVAGVLEGLDGRQQPGPDAVARAMRALPGR